MKKMIFAVAALLVALAACGGEEQEKSRTASQEESGQAVKEEDNESIEVEKGLLNVEITIPASFVGEKDNDEFIEEAKDNGVKKVIQNDDGSLTLVMSKAAHKKMMKEMEENVIKAIEETKNSGDFPSVKDIKYNQSFTEFTLVVNKNAYENSLDGIAILGLSLAGGMYQVFDGVKEEDIKIVVHVEDEATGEIFHTATFPDMMNAE